MLAIASTAASAPLTPRRAGAADAALPMDYAALRSAARARLPGPVFDWIDGGAGEERTLIRNQEVLAAARLVPRMLTGVGPPDMSLRLLGQALPHPVLVCPMGLHGVAHGDGELATMRGAAAAGALFIAAMVATHGLEAIAAAAPGHPRWFQIYVPRDRAIARDLVARAAAAGYAAVVPTVDAPVAAVRERDRRNRWGPPAALGAGNDRPGYAHPLMGGTDDRFDWAALAAFCRDGPLPVVVKGILHAEDAARAVDAGAAAIIVSSHGGRQLDGTPTSFEALPACVAAVAGRVPVLLDSGPRRGTDVLKALAAGATAVAIGRPVWWGLAVGGAAGVQAVLEQIVGELANAMRLSGCANLRAVGPHLLG